MTRALPAVAQAARAQSVPASDAAGTTTQDHH
jgi:hypothetical protein